MKISINLLKKWIGSHLDIKDVTDKLTLIGFETYIEKDKINVSIPYNRNNCANLFGIYNEIAKIFSVENIKQYHFKSTFKNDIKIKINDREFCPLFYGIVIKNINNNIILPKYIEEFLVDNNITLVNPLINIINYVTLIVGQPLHAYDLDTISTNIIITKTRDVEELILLNKKQIQLNKSTPVISDGKKIIAIPGIIGSYITRVKNDTNNIFLESAYFNSDMINDLSKECDIETYASNVFKNSINPALTKFALIYASYLINKLQGCSYSDVIEKECKKYIPKKTQINLYKTNISTIIGCKISDQIIEQNLKKIRLKFKKFKNYWKIDIPPHRKDLTLEENIIAEIVQLYGYHNIPSIPMKTDMIFKIHQSEESITIDKIMSLLTNHGFFEVITYSFVDGEIERYLHGNTNIITLRNPMSQNLNVMRSNLLQGLLKNVKYNLNRGQDKISIFEIGNVFSNKQNISAQKVLAGICTTNLIYKKQNGYENTDFFVIKNFIKQIYTQIYKQTNLKFYKADVDYLDEALNACILSNNKKIGVLGLINKAILEKFSIKQALYFFHLELYTQEEKIIPFFKKISKYPQVQRDVSLILKNTIIYDDVISFIKILNIENLITFNLLDLYNLENEDMKSMTLRFTFQDMNTTLIDEIINSKMMFLQKKLEDEFNAIIKM